MIFIAILDPRLSYSEGKTLEQCIADNKSYQIQREWVRKYCAKNNFTLKETLLLTTDNSLKPNPKCADLITSKLREAVSQADNVYVYFHCHGITENDKEYIKLNENAFIQDKLFMDILRDNKSKHVSVFLETCHASGLYEPDLSWYSPVTISEVNDSRKSYIYFKKPNGDYGLCSYTSNITIFSCSIKEFKSWTKSGGNNVAIGMATLAISTKLKTGETIFDYEPRIVADMANSELANLEKYHQYAQVHSPMLIASWISL